MSAPIERQFRDVLAGHGLTPGEIIADGSLHRFQSAGDGKNEHAGWYVLHANGLAAGPFGDWRTGLNEVWYAKPEREQTEAERQECRLRIEQAKAASAKAKGIAQEEARAQCATIWTKAEPVRCDHPYVIKKGIQASDARQLHDKLVVPLCDVNGVLRSLQFISPDGDKRFKSAGRIKGCFCLLGGPPKPGAILLLCEGWATGCSLHEATGYPVACAMNAGNLLAVAKALHQKYPEIEIVIAADDDVHIHGNPGLTKARAAADAVCGKVAVPDFGAPRPDGVSDFNDLHTAAGVAAVRACIAAARAVGVDVDDADGHTGAGDGDPDDEDQTAGETDGQTIARLARLSGLNYDRVRRAEARRLGVQVSTLDRLVRETRAQDAAYSDAPFPDVEPWPDPVDGADLLDELVQAVRRYIICEPDVAVAVALWCACTWLVDVVQTCPILLISAPERECGKTQLLSLVSRLVPRPAATTSISPSVLFRMIEQYQPTLLIDEIETVLTKEAEELRGLMNAGHSRDSAYVWRSVAVGDDFQPRRFCTFGYKAVAGINADKLADTITSRSILAGLRKKLPHELAERLRHADPGLFEGLQTRLARWADDHADAMRHARPALPDALSDRDQDNWEPLLAVADLAGGKWPNDARRTALRLCGREPLLSAGTELLTGIRAVFTRLGMSRIAMADLLAALCEDDEAPWKTWNRGKEMTARQLGRKLAEYGIHSKVVRIGLAAPKGFDVTQFTDAFSRYLSPRFRRSLGHNLIVVRPPA